MFGNKKKNVPHVFAAISGGVDSSVSAALLVRAGYQVTGAFIKGWHPPELPCTWRDDRRDAMRICAQLGIPFKTIDLSDAYKKSVADAMIAAYRDGHTPNPDVLCNQHIKFGAFLDAARTAGADYIATGHYARIDTHATGEHVLLRGVDADKDQTYFLWTLDQKVLGQTLFPIGDRPKSAVRALAERHNLATATKPDSQGVCFLGNIDMRAFLKMYLSVDSGDVLDTAGNVVGSHEGAVLYTLGQRHGFTLATQKPDAKPVYVIARNINANTITVSETPRTTGEAAHAITLSDINWISGVAPASGTYTCQIRHRQTPVSCKITFANENVPHISLAPDAHMPAIGQSLVLYDGEKCLGGGVVARIPSDM